MGLAKTEKFTDDQNELALFGRVFAHPARIAILQHLFKIKACVCGDLVDEIGLSQPTVSQHLKELRNLGLIKGDVEGTRVCYCVNGAKWNEMREKFKAFLDQDIEGDRECC